MLLYTKKVYSFFSYLQLRKYKKIVSFFFGRVFKNKNLSIYIGKIYKFLRIVWYNEDGIKVDIFRDH